VTDPSSHDDPFSEVKHDKASLSPTARQVNQLHSSDDIDGGPFAHHHSLGVNRNQSSPGDHIHNGKTSKKLGSGMGITLTGSRGGNAAVASIIAALKQIMDLTDSTTP